MQGVVRTSESLSQDPARSATPPTADTLRSTTPLKQPAPTCVKLFLARPLTMGTISSSLSHRTLKRRTALRGHIGREQAAQAVTNAGGDAARDAGKATASPLRRQPPDTDGSIPETAAWARGAASCLRGACWRGEHRTAVGAWHRLRVSVSCMMASFMGLSERGNGRGRRARSRSAHESSSWKADQALSPHSLRLHSALPACVGLRGMTTRTRVCAGGDARAGKWLPSSLHRRHRSRLPPLAPRRRSHHDWRMMPFPPCLSTSFMTQVFNSDAVCRLKSECQLRAATHALTAAAAASAAVRVLGRAGAAYHCPGCRVMRRAGVTNRSEYWGSPCRKAGTPSAVEKAAARRAWERDAVVLSPSAGGWRREGPSS